MRRRLNIGATVLADASGAVTGTYAYDVFGAVRAQSGATTEWSYTGEQNDPTGLEYLHARYYDRTTGRFVSQDPLPLLQRYAYVGNNPALFIDPYGLFGWKDVKKAVRKATTATAGVVGGTSFENIKNRAVSTAVSTGSAFVVDPNMSTLLNLYVVCRDRGRCTFP